MRIAYVAYSARISSQSARNCSRNMLDSSAPAICSKGEKSVSGVRLNKMESSRMTSSYCRFSHRARIRTCISYNTFLSWQREYIPSISGAAKAPDSAFIRFTVSFIAITIPFFSVLQAKYKTTVLIG